MRITALAGGVGGARFLRGLRAHLDRTIPTARDAEVTVIGNTGDDITLFGLRVCPDLDTLMYTLGGGIDEAQGWGAPTRRTPSRASWPRTAPQPQWFGLGDRDFGDAHRPLAAGSGQGMPLSEVTELLAARWGLPDQRRHAAADDRHPVETHVVVDDERRAAGRPLPGVVGAACGPPCRPQQIVAVGMDRAVAGPGVLDAIREADVVLLPPSNPVVVIGIILGVPGVRDALRGTPRARRRASRRSSAAGRCAGTPTPAWRRSASTTTAGAVAGLYADFLDGWLVDDAGHGRPTRPGAAPGSPSAVGRC